MKKRRILGLVLSSVLVAGIFTGCGSAKTDTAASNEVITVTDKKGEVEVTKNPERVVVLDNGSLDILDEIGVEVTGVPKSNLPSYLEKFKDDKYTDIGGVKEFNLETINEINPELIIIEGRQADSYEELSKIAPTIYLGSEGADYVNSIKNNAKILGQIFDKEDEVNEKLAKVDTKIAAVNKEVTDKNLDALVTMITDGSMSVYGQGSRYNILFNELGFKATDENIEVSKHGQSISFEYIAEKNPGYLFVIDKGQVTSSGTPAKETLENELVKTTDTYKNGNIVYLDAQTWYVGGAGFKALDTMIQEVENAINS